MTGFQLKVWACVFMFIDHMGLLLFPRQIVWRIVGRLAFPIFAWAIATGFCHTRDWRRYFLRLLLFGVAIQIPYTLFMGDGALNIFFTLALGLLSLAAYEYLPRWAGLLSLFVLALLAELIGADYGWYGVFTIFFFYEERDNFAALGGKLLLLNLLYVLSFFDWAGGGPGWPSLFNLSQICSLAALFFIRQYQGRRGRKVKWLFYIFYPAHLLFLYSMSRLLV